MVGLAGLSTNELITLCGVVLTGIAIVVAIILHCLSRKRGLKQKADVGTVCGDENILTIDQRAGVGAEELDAILTKYKEPFDELCEAREEIGRLKTENKYLEGFKNAVLRVLAAQRDDNREAAEVLKGLVEGKDLNSLVNFLTGEMNRAFLVSKGVEGEESLVQRKEEIAAVAYVNGFYAHAAELDKLKEIANPVSKDLDELLGIIRGDDALGIYFYENCKNEAWVRLLKESAEFKDLDGEQATILARMKAAYLAEVAEQKPGEVVEIISSVDAKDGFVQSRFLGTLLNLLEKGEDVGDVGVRVIKKYLERRDYKIWYLLGESAAKLMSQLAEKEQDKAFEIAEILLAVWRSEEKRSFKDLTARFEEFHYQEVIFKYYKKLWEVDALRATKLLAEIFNRGLEELAKDKDYAVESGFHIKLERLDQVGQRYERDIVAILVGGICEAGRAVMERQPDKMNELFDYLEGLRRTIFERIEMYLLRFVPAGTQADRIDSIIGNRKFLESRYWWYEYRLLLRDKFREIGASAKKVFTDWVEERGLDKEDKERIAQWFREREGREATEGDFEEIENSRKASEIYLVRNEFAELYEQCRGKSKAKDEELAPKPRVGEMRRVDPTEGAPMGVEDMVKMEPLEVVAYLSEPSRWKVDKKKESVFHTPEEGLEGVFEKVVQQRVDDYADLRANELINLEPIFLKRYFHGAWNALREKKIEEKSLVEFLERANYVVGEKSGSEDYEGVFRSIIYVVEGIFEDEPLRKKLVKENGKEIWGIIEPLARYEDKSDFGDKDEDPHQRCINCVPGQAFTLVVRFGLSWKNEDGPTYKKEWSGKICGVLDYVIENVDDERMKSAFGVWFPQLHWLEEKWVSDSLDRIFDSGDEEKWDAVWGSYMSWGRPYKKVFELLAKREKYRHAIERIGSTTKYKYSKDPEEGLVEHLMIAYFNGWIGFDHPLLVRFFEKAPRELRAHAVGFLSTGFKPVKEEGRADKKIRERLKGYWQARLEEIRRNREENLEEAVEFTTWVSDSLLDEGETLDLLYQTLGLTGGKLGQGRNVWDCVQGICEIADKHELMALRCLNKAVSDEQMAMDFSLYEEKLTEFMESVVQLPDDYEDVGRIRKEAIRLADAYGRMHIYKFRGVYEKLIEKV